MNFVNSQRQQGDALVIHELLIKSQDNFSKVFRASTFHAPLDVASADSKYFKGATKYTVLEIQFRSANYTLVARICKNFEQDKPCW